MVKTALPMQGEQVRSLMGELRSHIPHDAAKKIQNSETAWLYVKGENV